MLKLCRGTKVKVLFLFWYRVFILTYLNFCRHFGEGSIVILGSSLLWSSNFCHFIESNVKLKAKRNVVYHFFMSINRPILGCLSSAATQELKVLVDLALISSGESDMETDRISHLHTSCLGFAPLIFDLKETEGHKVNFDRLMEACEPVWNAVKADETLPQKLVRKGFFDNRRYNEKVMTIYCPFLVQFCDQRDRTEKACSMKAIK